MNMSEKESNNWYILFTAFRAEKKVKAQLDAAGITNYLPMKSSRVWWRNVVKVGSVPAVSRCIFVCLSVGDFGKLATIPSLLLPADFSDCILPAQQMDHVQILFREGNAPVGSVLVDDVSGAMARVISGDFQGLTGELLQVVDDCQILVRLNRMVGLSIKVTSDIVERV